MYLVNTEVSSCTGCLVRIECVSVGLCLVRCILTFVGLYKVHIDMVVGIGNVKFECIQERQIKETEQGIQ